MKKSRYPYPTWRVYWSVVLAVLSVILAFLLLHDVFHLTYFFVATSILTVAIYYLKTRFSFQREVGNLEEETPRDHAPWKMLILYFFMLIAIVFVPLMLSGFLDPYLWFILIISFTSGISVAEVFVYFHTR